MSLLRLNFSFKLTVELDLFNLGEYYCCGGVLKVLGPADIRTICNFEQLQVFTCIIITRFFTQTPILSDRSLIFRSIRPDEFPNENIENPFCSLKDDVFFENIEIYLEFEKQIIRLLRIECYS